MNVLAHRENGSGLLPRHPIVCILDIVGAAVAIGFLIDRPFLLVLPVAIVAQYGLSCLYHWLPFNKARQTLDHLMIAVLITATYVQFWIRSLPVDESVWRTVTLCSVMALILLLRIALPSHERLRSALYLVLGVGGFLLSISSPHLLPLMGWVWFLAGIGLYFVQFAIYALQKPDLFPAVFGFRELQHVILLAASSLHLVAAAIYL